jgi:diguanylate cyclase (GGDEF)-like protein/PAS domain S-box-containing protein
MTLDRAAEFSSLPAEFSAALLFAAVVDSSEDAIISQRLDGTIMSWNPAAERLYGWTAAEAIGRSIEIIMPENRREEFSTIMARFARGERVDHLETVRTRKDDSDVHISVTFSPIHDSDGLVVGSLGTGHDVTGRRRLEETRAQLASIVESAEDAIVSIDLDGYVMSWNEGAERLYGYSAAEMVGRFYGEILEGEALEEFKQLFARTVAGERLSRHETARPRRDGTLFEVSMGMSPIFAPDGSIVGASAILHDVTDRRRAEEKARGVESQIRMLAENSRDLIFRYRILPAPGFEFVSQASLAITGYAPEEFYAQPELIDRLIDPAARDLWLARVLSDHVKAAVDIELVCKDGSKIWVNQSLDAVRGATGEVVGMNGIARDIRDRKAAELRLEHEVLHDPLTGLPNRVLLMDRIEHGLSRAVREDGLVAVLFVDLDRFKVFNDTRGHGWGDAVLVAVAKRLVECSRAADTVGRLSGDEFVVVCEKLRDTTDAIKVADHILSSFNAPFEIDGEDVHVTASIGIATGEVGDSADKLLRDADLAMYRAKDRGRARYEADPSLANLVRRIRGADHATP